MTIYLASPNNQLQAHAAEGMPVLFSFACYDPWLDRYQASYPRVLVDSGAYSEFATGKAVDVEEYRDWTDRWAGRADAIAGLDDIGGDWRRSLRNYEAQPGGFPTFHDTDPAELLDDLVPMARERGGWLGIGLKPPRDGRREWLRWTLDRIPDDIHVHGWACHKYRDLPFDSIDSTAWARVPMRHAKAFPWLTYAECLDIEVKRYRRELRIADKAPTSEDLYR